MASSSFSSSSSSKHTIRSISLPSRSHPTTARIEEELTKLKTWEASSSGTPTAKMITTGLSRLEDLYKSMDDLLNLQLTQKAISSHQHEKCVDDLQDGFMSLLDVCGTAREVVSQVKDHSRDIQSCLRRRKAESDIETSVTAYSCFRKNVKKETKKLMVASKQMGASPFLEKADHHVSSVVKALREVVVESFSILHGLLSFLSVPILKAKPAKRSLVSKFLLKEDQFENVNELQNLDVALQSLQRNEGERMQTAQSCLKSLEDNIEAIENGLESLFRGLIKARSSLLNIVSA